MTELEKFITDLNRTYLIVNRIEPVNNNRPYGDEDEFPLNERGRKTETVGVNNYFTGEF